MTPAGTRLAGALISLALYGPTAIGATIFDFESYGDGDAVSDLYPGVALTNATAIVASASLNEFEFPPRSGNTVVFDDGGGIGIAFSIPVSSVAAYVTYGARLTVSAYDAALNLLATDLSTFVSNLALNGDLGSAPNELLSVASATDIHLVTIVADPAGGSFVMDDLTLEFGPGSVPEPPAGALLAIGAVLLGSLRGRASARTATLRPGPPLEQPPDAHPIRQGDS